MQEYFEDLKGSVLIKMRAVVRGGWVWFFLLNGSSSIAEIVLPY